MNKQVILLSVLALASAGTALGQNVVALPQLLHNNDTRSAGMGNTTLHHQQSPRTALGNYAEVFTTAEEGFTARYDFSLFDKVEGNRFSAHALGTSYRFGRHALSLAGRYASGLSIEGRNEVGNIYTLRPSDGTIDFAYAYQFGEGWSASAGARYIHSYNGRTAHAFGFTLGATHTGEYRLAGLQGKYGISVMLDNLGPRYSYSDTDMKQSLPTRFSINPSASLELSEKQTIGLALSLSEVSPIKEQPLVWGVGAEYRYSFVALRAGYTDGYTRHCTVGAGLQFRRCSLDLAYAIGESKALNVLRAGLSYKF